MKNVFFKEDILEVENEIINELGIPSIILMENAGRNACQNIINIYEKKNLSEIILLCGKGNNSGDGFVIARHLINNGLSVNIFMLYPETSLKGDAKTNYAILKNILETDKASKFISESEFTLLLKNKNNLIIDCIFGIGFTGSLEKHFSEIFRKVNEKSKSNVILAIDTVSGLSNNNIEACLKADYTITMGVKKFNTLFGESRNKSGKIKIVDIGIPENIFNKYNKRNIFEIEEEDVKGILPQRKTDSHKYSNGKLYLAAGSTGFTGAAHLTAEAALRIGCGAVILGVPASLNPVFEAKTIEVVTDAVPDNLTGFFIQSSIQHINEKLKWADTCLIGSGVGRNEETLIAVRKIIDKNDIQFVIDGDGLYAFRNDLNLLKKSKNKVIITPHAGEFSILINTDTKKIIQDIYNLAVNFAKENNVILVLKGSPTIITDGNDFFINSTGRENLATFGTGDVLAGIIAGTAAQIKNPIKAALFGVFLHGKCGDKLWNKKDNSSTIASDLLPLISEVKKRLA